MKRLLIVTILFLSFGTLGFGQAGTLQFTVGSYALPEGIRNIFPQGTTPTQSTPNSQGVELGVKFRADATGVITGIRFYKGVTDTGVHTGSLWTNGGLLLATGTFTNETATGWQQLNLNSPVNVSANTTYIASYYTTGSFFYDLNYFQNAGVDNSPLHALRTGVDGPNGLYRYGGGGVVPSDTYQASNYWVDVVYSQVVPNFGTFVSVMRTGGSAGQVSVDLTTSNGSATAGSDYVAVSRTVTFANGDGADKLINIPILDDNLSEGPETINVALANPTGGATLGAQNTAVLTINDDEVSPAGSLQFSAANYNVAENGGTAAITVTRTGGSTGAVSVHFATSNGTATSGAGNDYTAVSVDVNFANGDSGNKIVNIPILDDGSSEGNETVNLTLSTPTGGATVGAQSTSVLTINDDEFSPVGTLQFSSATYALPENGMNTIFSPSTIPPVSFANNQPVELGVRFRSDSSGFITSIRFYKVAADMSAHTGTLWTNAGAQLATGTFTNETASGWQTLNFDVPVAINANTTYVASYHTSTAFNYTSGGFFSTGVDNAPLHALRDGIDGPNGVYKYGNGGVFPNETYQSSNYWVDVIFTTSINAFVTVTRTGGSVGAVGATVATSNGSATAGSDYLAVSRTVSFANGDSANKVVTIPIINDTASEGNETVNLALSNPTGGTSLGSPNTATLTITDDEANPPGTLQFSLAAYSVGENGGNAAITVTRTGGSSGAVSVHLATSNGTATSGAGNDYTAVSVDVNFADGDTANKAVNVPILDDGSAEGAETVNLTLSSPTGGATLGSPNTAVLTINDDEVVQNGTLQFSSATYSLSKAGSTSLFALNTVPPQSFANNQGVELGVKIRSDVSGFITSIRFYKGATDTSVHTGSLWSSAGALLATGTFTNESASGWQQMNFDTPVAIAANTSYIASYHTSTSFFYNANFFQNQGVDNAPLHGLKDGADGANSLYRYGAGGAVPNDSYQSSNYWVDAVFTPSISAFVMVTRTGGSFGAVGATVATSNGTATAGSDYLAVNRTVSFANGDSASKTVTVPILAANFGQGNKTVNLALSNPTGGATLGSPSAAVLTIIDNAPTGTLQFSAAAYYLPETIFPPDATPTHSVANSSPIELGVKFRSDVSGIIYGIRFYKGPGDTSDEHSGTLWSSSGQLIATGIFANETASGWQTLIFNTAVGISPNTTYVASYNTRSSYFADANYFLTQGVDNPPLHALMNGVDGFNGVFQGGTGPVFPTGNSSSTNYWVDVFFTNGQQSATITITRTGGSVGAVGVHFSTSDGTATAGTDYTAVSTNVNFANGDTAPKRVNVPFLTDGFGGSKTLNLTLSSPTGGATLGTPNTAVLTILDTFKDIDCGTTISGPGVYRLTTDCEVEDGEEGISILGDGVLLDLQGHTISGSGMGCNGSVGVDVDNKNHITVRNGILTGLEIGLAFHEGHDNIAHDLMLTNNCTGLLVDDDFDDSLYNIEATGNSEAGVTFDHANANELKDSNISDNGDIDDGGIGILLDNSGLMNIHNNVISNNGQYGIMTDGVVAQLNNIHNNTALGNGINDFFDVNESCSNTWTNNTFVTDNETGPDFGPGAGCIR